MADVDSLFAEAQSLHRAGHLPQAQEFYAQVLKTAPKHGGALHMLGLIAFQAGDGERAVALLTKAAAADPDVPSLHVNLGFALTAAGRLRDAEASHRKALALQPGNVHALTAIAALSLTRGDFTTALRAAVAALNASENAGTRRLFADIAGTLRFDGDDPTVRGLLARAMNEAWGQPAPLAQAATALVLARLASGGGIESDALLRAALPMAPVTDATLEAALTAVRRGLLVDGGNAGFAAALAQQCFLNGYVFWQDADETARIAVLRARIEATLATGAGVADTELATLACYLPLHEIAGVEKIAANSVIAALLKQQRDERAEEQRIAATLPALTPASNHGAGDIYPRWSGLPAMETPVPPRVWLHSRFPAAALDDAPEHPAMLIAGCGTGQYALQLARTLTVGDVTAIDLDRAVLAFAARKAQDAGMDNVHFGQGDILNVAALEQGFGLIECGGVLHQLPDPLAGWAALLSVLEPGGLMRIAVHSRAAQQALEPVRAMLAAHGFMPTPDGIRAARQWLRQRDDASLGPVLDAAVFYSSGGCRHLLFETGEHPLSFGEIAAFLGANGLALIGLDVAPPVIAAYRARFSQDLTATDLDNWAAFEQEAPRTFAAMIQFWVSKRG